MKTWEVKTAEKKNVFQRTHFTVSDGSPVAAGKTFYMEEWYRWGRCVIRSEEKPIVADDPYQTPLNPYHYGVDDQEIDDGCYLDFAFEDDDEWTEDEKQWIIDLWDQDGWMAFEENNIMDDDCDTLYYGPLDIELIADDPDTTLAEINKASWPF